MHILSYVLTQFAVNRKTPKAVTDGIRAVAILMEDTYVLHITDNITNMVKNKIKEYVESLTMSIGDLRDAVEHIRDAAKTTWMTLLTAFGNLLTSLCKSLTSSWKNGGDRSTCTTSPQNDMNTSWDVPLQILYDPSNVSDKHFICSDALQCPLIHTLRF
jgi:hypothetical protein